ncbi:hypothetical protein XA68_17089 [Ophiocordyceps unilateralis]|uniref:Uncharacterized protein n=1 Tax=Ophiocordyceps unilateralis TaxID=268505 RepID=A0A2A9P406_OPHUN|nr:hypothetical protein XA68_17089 [Ophiocordyceps unilateralis]
MAHLPALLCPGTLEPDEPPHEACWDVDDLTVLTTTERETHLVTRIAEGRPAGRGPTIAEHRRQRKKEMGRERAVWAEGAKLSR